MQVEPWHIPLITMALVVLPPSIFWLVGWLRQTTAKPKPEPPGVSITPVKRELLRTRVLAALTLVLLVISFIAIGPAAASLIATAASAVSTIVSAALTLQSFLTLQEIRQSSLQKNADGHE